MYTQIERLIVTSKSYFSRARILNNTLVAMTLTKRNHKLRKPKSKGTSN